MLQLLPHLQSLLNILISRYINTGDRLLDNAIIAILSAFCAIIISYLPNLFEFVFCALFKDDPNSEFDPLKVDMSKMTYEFLTKYKYNIKILRGYMFDIEHHMEHDKEHDNYLTDIVLEKWIIKKFGLVNSTDSLEMYVDYPHKKELLINSDYNTQKINMPIHRYFINGRAEYIVYCNDRLYCNDLKELETFVLQFYENPIPKEKESGKYIFEVNNQGDIVKKGKINLKKSFDRLHFDKKTTIIDMLEKFKIESLYPDELSLDNKIGCLLYGPPGTAKTATCIATAIYLNRDILILNSLLSTPKNILLNVIEKCKNTHVIILDEFDYILSRKSDPVDYKKILEEAKTPTELTKAKLLANECKLSDDEFILKLLDGISDGNGRVIFATTNSIDKINPKFLRPGRFDMVLELSYCSFDMFVNICKSVYKDENLYIQHKSSIIEILKLNITPVILINSIIRTKNFTDMLDLLKSGEIEAFKNVNKQNTSSISTQTD